MASIITVDKLSKQYRLGARQASYQTVREACMSAVQAPLRWLRGQRAARAETLQALHDVSFQVAPGEVVGIIGRNGAGKSTLLKILSRITEPTTGEIELCGRVGSLLEVGTGFHPELTGRDNIYLNGAILGMTRREIARKFDEIVAFAEVDRFIDTAVKFYSSGMYMRLAFAVAAHLEPEILIVDEVLAVGDAAFQKKCLGKMSEVARAGRTVLFVSHNMHAVSVLCTRGLVLKRGRLVYDGTADGAVSAYLAAARESTGQVDGASRPGTGEFRFAQVEPIEPIFGCDAEKRFSFRIERRGSAAPRSWISAHVVNELGATLVQCDSRLVDGWLAARPVQEGELAITTPWLKPGRYYLDAFICSGVIVDHFEKACTFEVAPTLPYPHAVSPDATAAGVVFAEFTWQLSGAPVAVGET